MIFSSPWEEQFYLGGYQDWEIWINAIPLHKIWISLQLSTGVLRIRCHVGLRGWRHKDSWGNIRRFSYQGWSHPLVHIIEEVHFSHFKHCNILFIGRTEVVGERHLAGIILKGNLRYRSGKIHHLIMNSSWFIEVLLVNQWTRVVLSSDSEPVSPKVWKIFDVQV